MVGTGAVTFGETLMYTCSSYTNFNGSALPPPPYNPEQACGSVPLESSSNSTFVSLTGFYQPPANCPDCSFFASSDCTCACCPGRILTAAY